MATADIHERLHHHVGFAAVQAGTIDHGAYTTLLSRLYGFYRPFEAAAQLSPERTRWIESDLTALGVDAEEREKLPRCAAFPHRFSADHILGARYVVEGSALGGRGLARQLDGLLGTGVALVGSSSAGTGQRLVPYGLNISRSCRRCQVRRYVAPQSSPEQIRPSRRLNSG